MAPEFRNLTAAEAKKFLAEQPENSFLLLDVRQPAEYEVAHLPGARLLPLGQLEEAVDQLDKHLPVLTYCALGGRSRVAAQMLLSHGFREVYNLQGGIKAWQGETARGPVTLNLDLLPPEATPTEAARLAVGMEESLKRFYQELQLTVADPEAQELFQLMVEVSEKHKQKFLEFWAHLTPEPGVATLLADLNTEILEGGFRFSEFLQENAPHMRTLMGALEVAMMLEAQALDLYKRLADRVNLPSTRSLLLQVAQEEKQHLNLVGELLNRKVAEETPARGSG